MCSISAMKIIEDRYNLILSQLLDKFCEYFYKIFPTLPGFKKESDHKSEETHEEFTIDKLNNVLQSPDLVLHGKFAVKRISDNSHRHRQNSNAVRFTKWRICAENEQRALQNRKMLM